MNSSKTGSSSVYKYYKFIAAKLNVLGKYSDGIVLTVERLKTFCFLTWSPIR